MAAYLPPSVDEVRNACKRAGYDLPEEEIQYQYQAGIGMIDSLNNVNDYEISNSVEHRDIGEAPKPETNAHNQWAWRSNIQRNNSGSLADKKVGVKDCITVAGIPMQAGFAGLVDYIPSYDSPCITALLNEGAIIVGKTNCENASFSSFSHTSCNGDVMNPYNKKKTAGGSSSGSGVSVALGDVDMAIGTDTGGSVRMPASYCGLAGMKVTTGLIPTKGVTPIMTSLDTVGPLTRTVQENALFLSVMAKSNKMLQPLLGACDYSKDIGKGIKNLKIAILKEGFEFENSDPEINSIVKTCIKSLSDLGANFEEISIPEVKLGSFVLVVNVIQATYWLEDKYCPRGQQRLRYEIKKHFKDQNKLSHYAKSSTLLRYYLSDEEADRIIERSQDITEVLQTKFIEHLEHFDAICVPTIPGKVPDLPSKDLPLLEQFPAMLPAGNNTAIANLTGHPALTVNCGFTTEKMPVGIMFTGKYFDEKTLYRIGRSIEELQSSQN